MTNANVPPPAPPGSGSKLPVSISDEMQKSYLDYAMSVIIGRAIPDIRDGLKPVHRRILYAAYLAGLVPTSPFRKSATIVGDVLGSFHPHGDSSVYDAMVRLAQDFSMRYPLIDGQGNYGSVDGDPAAAYRYTEAKLSKIAMELLADIDKECVDFGPNFDDSKEEPLVLPAKFPNLLVNGTGGIAVGMATNIPPHNLKEVLDATIHLAKNPNATIDDMMRFVPGPDSRNSITNLECTLRNGENEQNGIYHDWFPPGCECAAIRFSGNRVGSNPYRFHCRRRPSTDPQVPDCRPGASPGSRCADSSPAQWLGSRFLLQRQPEFLSP